MRPAGITITLIGSFELVVGERRVPLSSTKDRALVAYLAVERTAPAARLGEVLWPGAAARLRNHSTSQAIYRIGKAAGIPLVTRSSEVLTLPPCDVDCDHLFRNVATYEDAQLLRIAQSEFLADVALSGCREFGIWREDVRTRMRAICTMELAARAESSFHASDWPVLLSSTEALLQLNAASERAVEKYAQTLAVTRGPAAAVARLRDWLTRLDGDERAENLASAVATLEARLASVQVAAVNEDVFDARGYMVGRREELQRLRDALRATRTGGLHVALVEGETGIGKTTLAAQLLRVNAIQGGRSMCATCSALESRSPMGALAPLVASLVEAAKSSDVAVRTRAALTDRGPDSVLSADGRRRVRQHAVREILSTIATDQQTVLLIEDIQWIDHTTLEILEYLMRHGRGMRMLLLLTARLDEVPFARDAGARALASEAARVGLTRIRLTSLTDRESDELVHHLARRSSTDLPAAVVSDIIAAAGGNPLGLVHCTRDEIARALAHGSVAAPTAKHRIPLALTDAIARRVRTISREARHLLRCMAVLDSPSPLEVLGEVSGIGEIALIDALEETIALELVMAAGDAYRLAHDRIRSIVYDNLLDAVRLRLHARAAQALEAAGAPRAVAAVHWSRARQRDKSFYAAVDAAQGATAEGCWADAESLWRLALDDAPGTEEQARVLTGFGGSLLRRMRFQDVVALIGPFRQTPAHDAFPEVQFMLAHAELAHDVASGALPADVLVERALELLASADAQGLLRQSIALLASVLEVAHDAGRGAVIITLLPRMIALSNEAAVADDVVEALCSALRLSCVYGPIATAEALADRLLLCGPLASDRSVLVLALLAAATARYACGELDNADRLHRVVGSILDEEDDPVLRERLAFQDALVSMDRGEFARATSTLRKLQEDRPLHDRLFVLCNLAAVAVDSENALLLRECVESMRLANSGFDATWIQLMIHVFEGLLAILDHDSATAASSARAIRDVLDSRPGTSLGDHTYLDVLEANVLARTEGVQRAVEALNRRLASMDERARIPRTRIKLAIAEIARDADRDLAWRLSQDVCQEGATSGARWLVDRAERVRAAVRAG
jgi:DNA-binding SARP family transcriptional activator